tara:strand:- start:30258 stop:31943 length:1686 start_codon:yes stop_codon:yes gene_type:complete
MKISGVLALFPLTIVATFLVLQQQIVLEKPFERHAGAYTDVAHLISSIKNSGSIESLPARILPATRPLRQNKIKITPGKLELNLASSDQSAPNKVITKQSQESALEDIWRDHVSSAQAASAKQADQSEFITSAGIASAPNTGIKVSEPSVHGLLSPAAKTVQEIPKNTHEDENRSAGFVDDQALARLDLLVVGANLNGASSEIEMVEFSAMADDNEIISAKQGRFSFEKMLATKRQIMSGVFSAKDFVTTRVDLPMEVGSFGSLIPMVSISSMDKLLRKKQLNAPGGFVLVDLDQEIIDVELDRRYQDRIYFNSEFKETGADDSARFVMFVGVEPGNTMLRYLVRSRKIVERVALVVEDQILYDLPIIEAATTHSFGLFEMESLSLTPRELTISSRKIHPFNKKRDSVQDTLNHYSLDFDETIMGTRKYTEIEHLGTTFFAGHTGQDRLIVPGQGFINEVLAFHNLDRLERQCLIQVNLPRDRELYEVKMLGEGAKGPLLLDESYLNRDGTVSIEATEFSTHAFVLGDMQGRVYIKLEYIDGTMDYINSYCADGAYLVEHL